MSLEVSSEQVARVRAGQRLEKDEFLDLIRMSLPRGFAIVQGLIDRISAGEPYAEFTEQTLDDESRGQLLRIKAGTRMSLMVEEYAAEVLGKPVTFAFQNCHRAALFPQDQVEALTKFISVEDQILNQSPSRRDC